MNFRLRGRGGLFAAADVGDDKVAVLFVGGDVEGVILFPVRFSGEHVAPVMLFILAGRAFGVPGDGGVVEGGDDLIGIDGVDGIALGGVTLRAGQGEHLLEVAGLGTLDEVLGDLAVGGFVVGIQSAVGLHEVHIADGLAGFRISRDGDVGNAGLAADERENGGEEQGFQKLVLRFHGEEVSSGSGERIIDNSDRGLRLLMKARAKFQTPNSKFQRNSKIQNPRAETLNIEL